MGTTVVPVSRVTNHNHHLEMFSKIFICLCLLQATTGLFFGTPSSSCNRDSQCRSFGRSQCLGNQFIFCFGPSRAYTVPGRCLNRSNFFCDVGNVFRGGRRPENCSYRECAQCLNDSDCSAFNEYCSNFYCVQRPNNNNKR